MVDNRLSLHVSCKGKAPYSRKQDLSLFACSPVRPGKLSKNKPMMIHHIRSDMDVKGFLLVWQLFFFSASPSFSFSIGLRNAFSVCTSNPCVTVRSGFLARFLIMARYVLVQGPCHRQRLCQKAIRQGYRTLRPPKRWYVSCYCKGHAIGKKRAKPGGRGLPGQGRGWGF